MLQILPSAEKKIQQKSLDTASQSEYDTNSVLPSWLIKLCRPSRMLWLAPVIGFMLTVPSFFSGYSLDDHILRQSGREQSVYHQRSAWDYFNLVSSDEENASYREKGIFGWWTPDGFRFRAFRPLSSLLHALQFHLFDNSPWVMHLGLALLYALLIFLCAHLLIAFSASSISAGIGILLFAINDTHAITVGWISSYNTVLCCISGLFAFMLYTHWYQKKRVSDLLFSNLFFILSLLSSEGGLALLGYLIAHVLFIEKNTWSKKIVNLSPYVVISGVYLSFYTLNNYGAKLSGVYLSPADDPAGTFMSIIYNTVVLTVSQMVSFAPFSIMLTQIGATGIIASLLIFVFILALLRKSVLANKRIAFFGTAMLLSIIPFTLNRVPMDRLLLWSGFGAAGFLGELASIHGKSISKMQKKFTGILLFNNIVFSLLFFIPMQFLIAGFDGSARSFEQQVTSDTSILINIPTELIMMFPPAIKCAKGEEWPSSFYTLYAGTDTLTLKRTSENTLIASTAKGWFAASGEQITRADYVSFSEGDSVNVRYMNVRVLNVNSDGRPLSVEFTFKGGVSQFRWLKWENRKPQSCELPPVGEEVKLVASLF